MARCRGHMRLSVTTVLSWVDSWSTVLFVKDVVCVDDSSGWSKKKKKKEQHNNQSNNQANQGLFGLAGSSWSGPNSVWA